MRITILTIAAALAVQPFLVAQTKQTAYRRSNQKSPTMDRYREIQQVLIEYGYMIGPADGKWGPSSVEAVKRFQKDHNLGADGKLGALTLTALGLGPRRGQPPLVAAKPADAPPAAPQVE